MKQAPLKYGLMWQHASRGSILRQTYVLRRLSIFGFIQALSLLQRGVIGRKLHYFKELKALGAYLYGGYYKMKQHRSIFERVMTWHGGGSGCSVTVLVGIVDNTLVRLLSDHSYHS